MRIRYGMIFGILFGLAIPVSAQPEPQAPPPPRPKIPANGTHIFRELLGIEGIEPIASRTEFAAIQDYRNVILILQQHRGFSAEFPIPPLDVRRILEGGGSVLITVDRPLELDGYFPVRTRLSAVEKVYCPNPTNCYAGNGWQVLPQAKFGLIGPGQELFLGVNRLMTHSPMALHPRRISPYANTILAVYPDGCLNGGPNGPPLETDSRAFAVSGAGDADDPFRCLVVGDPTVYQNYPIAVTGGGPDATQNLHFAFRTVRWLKGTGKHQRTKCLFVENGVVRTDFKELGLFEKATMPNPPMPPVPNPLNPKLQAALTDMANQALAKIEDSDIANRALAGSDRRFTRTLRALAVIVAVLGAIWLLHRMRTSRHSPDIPKRPRETPFGYDVADVPRVGTVAHRRAELVEAQNLTEPLRDFLRELFAERGLPTACVGDPMPRVTLNGANARALHRDLKQVWNAMFGAQATVITPAVWKELEPMIESIRRAAEADRFTFTPAEGTE